jgi:hypothetical protein
MSLLAPVTTGALKSLSWRAYNREGSPAFGLSISQAQALLRQEYWRLDLV